MRTHDKGLELYVVVPGVCLCVGLECGRLLGMVRYFTKATMEGAAWAWILARPPACLSRSTTGAGEPVVREHVVTMNVVGMP